MTANRFDQLIDEWSPKLKAAFLDAIYLIRDAAQIGLIAERLEQGDVDGALRAAGLDPIRFRALDAAIIQAFEAGGKFTAGQVPMLRQPGGYRLEVLFDVRNIRAESWLRTHSAMLVRQIVDDQREAIRAHLRAGMEAGNNPRTVALDLVGRINRQTGRREGGIIGLTASQEGWARAYREELTSLDRNALARMLRDKRFDRTILAAINGDRPLTKEQIDRMVTAYRNRALRYRAETIGRTEAMSALGQSQDEAMRQAIERGEVRADAVSKVWHTAGDHMVRDTHAKMNRQSVGFSASFVSPSGARLAFPGDPEAPAAERINCRCWQEIKIDFLAKVA